LVFIFLALPPCIYLAPSMVHSFILFKTAKKNEPRKSRPEIKLIPQRINRNERNQYAIAIHGSSILLPASMLAIVLQFNLFGFDLRGDERPKRSFAA